VLPMEIQALMRLTRSVDLTSSFDTGGMVGSGGEWPGLSSGNILWAAFIRKTGLLYHIVNMFNIQILNMNASITPITGLLVVKRMGIS